MAHMTQTSRTHKAVRGIAAGGAGVLAALVLAACGGGSDREATAASSTREQAQEGALRFARCMRGEGLDFPDPQVAADGGIRIRNRRDAGGPRLSPGPDDPKFRAATEKCRKHLRFGGGERPSPAQQAKFRDAFLKFARCMRANGVNVPDPKFGGGAGFVMRMGPRGINPESPKFRKAEAKCRPLLAEARPGATREGP